MGRPYVKERDFHSWIRLPVQPTLVTLPLLNRSSRSLNEHIDEEVNVIFAHHMLAAMYSQGEEATC